MAKHNFRLQSVLDYRQTLVDRMRLDLAALQARVQEEVVRLEGFRASERRTLEEVAVEQQRVLDLPRVIQLTEHLDVMNGRIAEQSRVVDSLHREFDRLQESFLTLVKDVKVLEKLRDRQVEEHALEERRLERVEASEIAATQYRRLGAVS
jgi:flagellar protein FliJ